jgi:hypothetical protein
MDGVALKEEFKAIKLLRLKKSFTLPKKSRVNLDIKILLNMMKQNRYKMLILSTKPVPNGTDVAMLCASGDEVLSDVGGSFELSYRFKTVRGTDRTRKMTVIGNICADCLQLLLILLNILVLDCLLNK